MELIHEEKEEGGNQLVVAGETLGLSLE